MASVPSLWCRLHLLQPTLPLVSPSSPTALGAHPKRTVTAPSRISYSFSVVPPPAPAATSAFHTHVNTLLRHVPHPIMMSCTSYSPYFSAAAAERVAVATGTSDDSANSMGMSATQQALAYLHERLPGDVSVFLTVTATRATCPADSGQSAREDYESLQEHPKPCALSSAPARTQATKTSLVGASRSGVAAVLADFRRRISTPTPTEMLASTTEGATPLKRSGGLIVLRGDDGGYTWRRLMATQQYGTSECSLSAAPNPYLHFSDGISLLRFISTTLSRGDVESGLGVASRGPACPTLCLCIGGYPQGHALDRQWDTAEEGASTNITTTATAESTASEPIPLPLPAQTLTSLRFLGEMDAVYARTEVQLQRARGTRADTRPLSLASCWESTDALQARLDAVRRLWTTPSSYPAGVRTACTRRTVADKVLLRQAGTPRGFAAGAHVVLTQMITSAMEFLDYVEDIRGALRASVTTPDGTLGDLDSSAALPLSSPSSLIVVPGIMAPLRAEHFLRSVLQLKIIPSPPLQAALREYEETLHSAVDTLSSASATTTSDAPTDTDGPTEAPSHDTINSASRDAVKAYQQVMEAAEVCFEERMVDLTTAMIRDLRASGYTHMNFFAFQYGCGDAVGRVVAALDAEGGEEGSDF